MRSRCRNPGPFPPPDPKGWKVYYDFDPDDLPTIQAVAAAWRERVRARDSNFHGYYPLKSILRAARPGNFLRETRHRTDTLAGWETFVKDIATHGIREAVMLEIDPSGMVVVGEGNHRIAALLEIYPPYQRDQVNVPVRFYFREQEFTHRPAGLTWATFTDPDRFTRPFEPARKGPAARRRERRTAARTAERDARARDLAARGETQEQQAQIEELMKLILGE